ncbi:hypothetical protein EGW08_005148 [Elysia chlorotica]|uniref:TROVE domain-containing protein n=1 Tax=Elysia chlorotica TaxID=188477 RepID=A0A3S1CA27_ELYCH|nr:hypothetical protein EGW08_005148 [Elysia chlorotica]
MTEAIPSNLDLLTRLVCTGSENGFFNAHEKPDLCGQSHCLGSFLNSRESGLRAVHRLRLIFNHKSFISKEPLLFCLAKIIRNSLVTDSHREDKVRQEAYTLAGQICESADDLFTFVDFDKKVSELQKAGWGKGMRRLVHQWYEKKTPRALALQVTRCKSARGWSHRDLLRQCHMPPGRYSKGTALIVKYLLSGKKEIENYGSSEEVEVKEIVTFLQALEALNASSPEEKELVRTLIETHRLVDRQIPSKLYKLIETYEGMLGHISMEDLFRNIPKMALMGMLDKTAHQSSMVIERISDIEAVKEQKVNPIIILCALRKYTANRCKRWVRNGALIKALQAAFDASVEILPKLSEKSLLIAVHLEGEGRKKLHVKGASYVTPAIATAHVIKFLHQTEVIATHVFFNERVEDLPINSKTPVVEVLESLENRKVEDPSFDLAEPIKWAKQKKAKFENILIISDLKKVTSAQDFQDCVKQYRTEVSLPNCKVALLGLSELETSVADSKDLNLLEVSGLNGSALQLLLRFFKGDFDFGASKDGGGPSNIGV